MCKDAPCYYSVAHPPNLDFSELVNPDLNQPKDGSSISDEYQFVDREFQGDFFILKKKKNCNV